MATIAGLAAGVAHEINTPLSGILQSMQMIEMGFDPNNEQNRTPAAECGIDLKNLKEYIRKTELDFFMQGIRNSATTASTIIADLLQFSRPSSRKVEPADLNKLIDYSIELAKSDYSLKKEYRILDVDFIRDYDPALPEIWCMAMEIEQVLINLIKNSCQAFSAGDVATESPTITLRTRQRGGLAVIEVVDNGPGMDQETRHRVFNPFFTTKGVGAGTGLGLAVSYSIICEKHQGRIWFESTPGDGTRCIIELPQNGKAGA
jgi:signal transduction histidine kinase